MLGFSSMLIERSSGPRASELPLLESASRSTQNKAQITNEIGRQASSSITSNPKSSPRHLCLKQSSIFRFYEFCYRQHFLKLREVNKSVWDQTASHTTQTGFGFTGSKVSHKIRISRQGFSPTLRLWENGFPQRRKGSRHGPAAEKDNCVLRD